MGDVMRGWETFDAVSPGREPDLISRALTGTEGWHPSEVPTGVACVQITTNGDDPAGAFVKVTGPDRQSVEAAFDRARNLVLSGAVLGVFKETA